LIEYFTKDRKEMLISNSKRKFS